MKILRLAFLLITHLALLIALAACKSDAGDCFKSTGKIVREARDLSSFTAIHLRDNVQVVLTADTSGMIYVEAGEHLLSKINTHLEGSMLMISNENTCNWVRSYKKLIKIYIGIGSVKDIFHYGYADIETEGFLTVGDLFVHHYGNGNIHLKLNGNLLWMDMDHLGDFVIEGKINELNGRNYNLGKLRAENLDAQDVYFLQQGQGDAYVRASSNLGVTITNDGNVYYFGNPTNAGVNKTGKGNLVKGD